MEDYEVRQALAIIKDRVTEITKQPDWKEQITQEWNDANAEEAAARRAKRASATGDDDTRSQVTYRKYSYFKFIFSKDSSLDSPNTCFDFKQSRMHPKPPRQATSREFQRPREERQRRSQNGTPQQLRRETDHRLKTVSPIKLPQKCCATTPSYVVCIQPTLSRSCSRRRPSAKWPSLRKEESIPAQSSPSTKRKARETRLIQAIFPTCTRTRLFENVSPAKLPSRLQSQG